MYKTDPIKGWFSSAFSQSPTIPPTEDRGLWLRDETSEMNITGTLPPLLLMTKS